MIEAKTMISSHDYAACDCGCERRIRRGESFVLVDRGDRDNVIHPDCSESFLKRLEGTK